MKIDELTETIDKKVAAYRSKYASGTRLELEALNREVVALQAQRSKAIAEGCSKCPSCGAPPIGLLQTIVVAGEPHDGYEIGCPVCLDHRAKATELTAARALWEIGPTVPEERDEAGNVTKRAKRGWISPQGRSIERVGSSIVSTVDGQKIDWSKQTRSPVERRRLSVALRGVGSAIKIG